jgi:hypothetical protein
MIAFLVLRGADFRAVNVDEHPREKVRLESELKRLETPTIETDGERYVAPTMSELKALLAAWGLDERAAPHTRLED